RNIGQTGKRQPRLFDMDTDPKKVNLLTVNWQLFLFFAGCFYLLYYRTLKKVNLLTVNWQLFQVDELIAPTPAANLR
ncbi:MAG: hypothetical protein PUD52_09345, partial [Prevotella sp.]|nr:hypothetical protein [Prevotella sp.]